MSRISPDRRDLAFRSLDEILADAERVLGGPHRTTGSWTAPQIVWHVADLIAVANGHMDLSLPLPLKAFGRTLKLLRLFDRPIPSGIRMPKAAAANVAEAADREPADSLAHLRREVEHANRHPMTHPSPLFGRLTPHQWLRVNCRHADLHFSFMHPIDAARP